MLRTYSNFNLKPYNTFNISAIAKYFVETDSIADIQDFLRTDLARTHQILVLGGGSNMLFVNPCFEGIVLHPTIMGIELVHEDNHSVELRVGAGVEWDNLVEWAVDHGFSGIENLSLIPGNVGASPVQNIGAYGVEAKDCILTVECIDIKTGKLVQYSRDACRFSYRNSIFKQDLKDKHIISHVHYQLTKNTTTFKVDYKGVVDEIGDGPINLKTIRQAIVNIRKNKLPDHEVLGNAGSFFKNPIVSNTEVSKLKANYPEMPIYPLNEDGAKLAAGWLIDQCGWKGKRVGDCGVHSEQALVLINHGTATGAEVLEYAEQIAASVKTKFNVNLESEVNLV